jgi:hypothetical protein
MSRAEQPKDLETLDRSRGGLILPRRVRAAPDPQVHGADDGHAASHDSSISMSGLVWLLVVLHTLGIPIFVEGAMR